MTATPAAVPGSVVVVGAGLAGTRVVEGLRSLGARSRITVVGAETLPPYDRPPLSKQVLRGERDLVSLRKDWTDLDVDLRLGRRGAALHPADHVLLVDDGERLEYDALVIATGAEPRHLPGLTGEGAHVLRTLDDARALSADIRRTGALVVVGGGFIGCEAAASARALGAEVTLVEILPAPLARVLGPQVAAEVARLHADAGVRLLCGVSVVDVRGEGADRQLVLSDASVVDAPVVLAGLGVLPDTAWLEGSGVEVDDGVVCDATGRTCAPQVWAAGDVARWWHPLYGAHVRVEHWTSAAEQGAWVARGMVGGVPPLAEVPYVWSDQYRTKFQLLGRPSVDDDVTLLRVGPGADRLLALYGRQGRFTAVLGASAPKWVMRLRGLLADGGSYADALAAARA